VLGNPSFSLTLIKLNVIEAILPQVQVPQDLWEHSFGGRCGALEYALGLGYRQYVLVIFLSQFNAHV
jgi:hypothetical protein